MRFAWPSCRIKPLSVEHVGIPQSLAGRLTLAHDSIRIFGN